MNFDFKCPHCGAKYEATPEDMNRNFSCEVCGKNFVVQSVGGTQARPTPQTGSQRKVVIKPRRNAAKGKKVTTKPLRLAVSSRPPFTVLHEPIKPTSQTPRSQTKERETIFDTFAIAFEDAIVWLNQSFWPFVLDVYDAAVNWFRKSLWPYVLIVAIGLTVFRLHKVNHLRKGETSAICPICWFTDSEELVPSFIGTRKLVDVCARETTADKEYLYEYPEYSGDTLKISQVISSPKGVLVSHKDWQFDQDIFIEMGTRNLVDGDALPPMKVQYVGLFKFKTVLGAERRLRGFRVVSKYKLSPKGKTQPPDPEDY